MIELPKFTIEKIEKLPVSSKYNQYRHAVDKLQEGEAVVVRGLDQKTLWNIQSNMSSTADDNSARTKSVKEDDGTYTLYLTKKEAGKKKKK